VCLVLCCLNLAACAHYRENLPIERVDPAGGYRVRASANTGEDAQDSEELALVLTFSGGGTRAAAFSYGVLAALHDIEIEFDGRRRRLSDEIDIISSVSAGSMTAAYFGLHGADTFQSFPDEFLYHNVQRALLLRFLAPWNWVRFVSGTFGRGDLMAQYFDEQIFHGKTYSDLLMRPRPAIIINATDLAAGTQFSFDQDQFDLLCSDLTTYPVANAVAASSAVPVAFSPLTLVDYPSRDCNLALPSWIAAEASTGDMTSRRYQEARRLEHYGGPEGRQYVHLVDGGISDNLGLRAVYDKATFAGGYVALTEMTGYTKFRRVLHIVVNAQKERSADAVETENPPGPLRTLQGASSLTLDRYAFETVENFQRDIDTWMEELKTYRCAEQGDRSGDCSDLAAYFIELNLAQHPDSAERDFLVNLPTTLRLDREAVDRVVAAAATVLNQSEDFKAFVRDIAALD
jgi:NTE family protein